MRKNYFHICFWKKIHIVRKTSDIFWNVFVKEEIPWNLFSKYPRRIFTDILLNWIIKSIPNSENDTGLIFEKESITISYKYVKTFPINVLKMWKGKKIKKLLKLWNLIDWFDVSTFFRPIWKMFKVSERTRKSKRIHTNSDKENLFLRMHQLL